MSYTLNKIEILEPHKIIQIREQEQLELADGTIREGGYRRYAVTPDTDIETIPDEQVRALATLLWTPEIVSAYAAKLAESAV